MLVVDGDCLDSAWQNRLPEYGEPNNNLPQVRTVDKLLSEHKEQIRRFIDRRCGPAVLQRTTADDLFQQTAIAALASAENFAYVDDAGFIAWVSTIARRVISQSLRDPKERPSTVRIRRMFSSGTGVSESRLFAPNRTPSSAVASSEWSDSVVQTIGRLPPHYRLVLQLYRIEERPLAEVAQRMNLTKGATCRLIARAVAMLRDRLGEEE